MILELKAKVLISSEEQMEAEAEYDMGSTPNKAKQWIVTRIGIASEDIKRVIEYRKGKTIIEMHEGESILVYEPFDDVFSQWYWADSEIREIIGEERHEEKEETEEDE